MTRGRRRWVIAGGVMLLLVAAVFVVSLLLPDELDAYVARLGAAGEPVTFEQVVAPAWGPEENAADELLVILEELIADIDSGNATGYPVGHEAWADLSAEDRDLLTTQLERHDGRFERLRDIVLKHRFRFDTRGLSKRAEQLSSPGKRGILTMSHLLRRAVERELAATEQAVDPEAHLRWLETLCALGWAWEPITRMDLHCIGHLDLRAADQVRRALAAGRLDPVTAHARLEPLLRRSRVGCWGRAQSGQRVSWLNTYAGQLGGKTGRVPDEWMGVPPGMKLDWGQRLVLQTSIDVKFSLLDSLVALDTTSAKSARDSMDALIAGFEDTRWWGGDAIRVDPRSDARFLDRCIRVDTDLHLARIALAAAAHRAKTGEWPSTTSELVPLLGGEEPLDCKGLPYTLSVTPEGDLTIDGTVPRGTGPMPEWRLPR